jgi:outer membrane immunogenic protein
MTRRSPIKAGLALLAIAVMTGSAEAQARRARAQAPAESPRHQWTGFYAGGNLGYGVAGLTDNTPLAVATNMTGVIGGVQAGYNYQWDRAVIGIEADIQASNQSATYSYNIPGLGTLTADHRISYFGTVRGKLGYAFDCGCVMAYGTLGWAYGEYRPSLTALGVTVSADYARSALAVGAGVEWKVTQRWSAKLEAIYLDTGNIGTGITFPVIGEVNMRVRDAVSRLGVNYHF